MKPVHCHKCRSLLGFADVEPKLAICKECVRPHDPEHDAQVDALLGYNRAVIAHFDDAPSVKCCGRVLADADVMHCPICGQNYDRRGRRLGSLRARAAS